MTELFLRDLNVLRNNGAAPTFPFGPVHEGVIQVFIRGYPKHTAILELLG